MSSQAALQLADELETRLIWPLQTLLGTDSLFDMLRQRAEAAAGRLTAELESGEEHAAAQTAVDLVTALFPGETPIPGSWWATPLGNLVTRTVGHPSAEAVSLGTAAAMLGVSKGRVQQLVERNKLERHPGGGVTSASVRERARAAR